MQKTVNTVVELFLIMIAVTFTDALPGIIEENIPRYGVAAPELNMDPAGAELIRFWKKTFKGQQ